MAVWQEGDKEEFVVLLHRGGRLSNKNTIPGNRRLLTWTLFFLFSAMGRRPEINHS